MSKPRTRDRPPGLITTPGPGPSAGDSHSPFWQGSSGGSLTCPPMAPQSGLLPAGSPSSSSTQATPPAPGPTRRRSCRVRDWRAFTPPPGAALANRRGEPPREPRPRGRRLGPSASGVDLGGRAWSLVGLAAAPAGSRLCGWNRAVDTSQGKDAPRSVQATGQLCGNLVE